MKKTFLAQAIAIIFAGLVDVVFVGSLPYGFHSLHIVVLGIVFASLLTNVRVAAWWALGGGLILELFSFRFFGSHLIALFLVLLLVFFLFEKVVTNRSVYSLFISVLAATALYDLIFLLFDYWSGVELLPGLDLLKAFGISLACNGVIALAMFYIFNLATRRLRPVFLSSKY